MGKAIPTTAGVAGTPARAARPAPTAHVCAAQDQPAARVEPARAATACVARARRAQELPLCAVAAPARIWPTTATVGRAGTSVRALRPVTLGAVACLRAAPAPPIVTVAAEISAKLVMGRASSSVNASQVAH